MKLVLSEHESDALADFLAERALASSEIVLTELPRAVQRSQTDAAYLPSLTRESAAVLRRPLLVPLTRSLLTTAGQVKPVTLRSLDAIHVAAALTIAGDLAAAITYDRRQAEAFAQAGLTVLAPGAG